MQERGRGRWVKAQCRTVHPRPSCESVGFAVGPIRGSGGPGLRPVVVLRSAQGHRGGSSVTEYKYIQYETVDDGRIRASS